MNLKIGSFLTVVGKSVHEVTMSLQSFESGVVKVLVSVCSNNGLSGNDISYLKRYIHELKANGAISRIGCTKGDRLEVESGCKATVWARF